MFRVREEQNEYYQKQQWSEIIAHYQIQVKVQRQKLQQLQSLHRKKLQQMQRRIRQQVQQRQQLTVSITNSQPLQLEIQSRRRQVERLTIKLQQLRKSPQTKYSTIDQQLIPSQSYQKEIQEKQKQIRMLQNQLIQAENIFQGKYVIEHKLINQYQMELKMNKKLLLQLDQYQKVNDTHTNTKNRQNTLLMNQYKKLTQQIDSEIQVLKSKIKTIESQNKLSEKRSVSTQYIKLNDNVDKGVENVNLQEKFGRIFVKQQQDNPFFNNYSNLNSQHHIKVQTLQIQNLQSKLESVLQANQKLLELKSQKQAQLQKIKELNQQTENQRKQAIFKNKEIIIPQEVELRQPLVMENQIKEKQENGESQERKSQQTNENENKQEQPQGLLESVIRFFRGFNNKQQETEPKEVKVNEAMQKSPIKPITSRDTITSSVIINKESFSPGSYIQKQDSRIRNSTPQQNKYTKFGLEQIYKKNTPKTQAQQKN